MSEPVWVVVVEDDEGDGDISCYGPYSAREHALADTAPHYWNEGYSARIMKVHPRG